MASSDRRAVKWDVDETYSSLSGMRARLRTSPHWSVAVQIKEKEMEHLELGRLLKLADNELMWKKIGDEIGGREE